MTRKRHVATRTQAFAPSAAASAHSPVGRRGRDRCPQTPEALGALQKVEIENWRPIIKAAISRLSECVGSGCFRDIPASDDPLQFGQAGTAIRARTERFSDLLDARH